MASFSPLMTTAALMNDTFFMFECFWLHLAKRISNYMHLCMCNANLIESNSSAPSPISSVRDARGIVYNKAKGKSWIARKLFFPFDKRRKSQLYGIFCNLNWKFCLAFIYAKSIWIIISCIPDVRYISINSAHFHSVCRRCWCCWCLVLFIVAQQKHQHQQQL